MNENSDPSLSTLPIELLYRLLDYLDIQTIFLSFRYVSKTFYLISLNCRRYNLDFRSISKNHFDSICRLIHPEQIVSIVLSDDDTTPGQIQLFFSLFQLTNFAKLRSLTLYSIDSKQLDLILNDIVQCQLTSFIFSSHGKRTLSTFCLLSSLIIQLNLRKLSMNTHAHHLEGLCSTTNQIYLTHLTVGILTFKEYQTILRLSHDLQVFIVDDCWINEFDQISSNQINCQVQSLTFRNTNRSLKQFEYLLQLTPSLISLTILNSSSTHNSLIDGFHWEHFIQTKLSSLEQFQFIFHQSILRIYDDIDVLIQPFRTKFWLEIKQWFVNCQSNKISHLIQFYSVPYSQQFYEYHFNSNNNILRSTSMIMNYVRCLSLNLTEIQIKSNEILFDHVNELKLRFDGEQLPIDTVEFISTLINLSNLECLCLQYDFDRIDQFKTLIDQAINLTRLILLPCNPNRQYPMILSNIGRIVPHSIKHFTLSIQRLNDMKFVLENFTFLSSISFNLPNDRKINSDDLIEWLTNIKRIFTYHENEYSLHFWLNSNK